MKFSSSQRVQLISTPCWQVMKVIRQLWSVLESRNLEIFMIFLLYAVFMHCLQGWDRSPPKGKIMKFFEKKLSDEVLGLATCITHQYSMMVCYEGNPATLRCLKRCQNFYFQCFPLNLESGELSSRLELLYIVYITIFEIS